MGQDFSLYGSFVILMFEFRDTFCPSLDVEHIPHKIDIL